jgi:uncharacterized protein
MTTGPRTTPLTDAEISELDELLLAIPDERDPLDIVMLDGFLVGVLLQPEPVLPSAWLPLVFDAQGREIALPGGATEAERASGLVMRRHDELAAHIAAREPFDPIVFELEDDDGKLLISDRPIMPACARVVGVLKDQSFEELLEQSTLKR